MGGAQSIGQTVADQLALPSVNDTIKRGERAVTRVTEDVESVGREVAVTKNQTVDTVQYAGTLVFVAVGGALLIYGPDVFSTFRSLGERVAKNGIQVGFAL